MSRQQASALALIADKPVWGGGEERRGGSGRKGVGPVGGFHC